MSDYVTHAELDAVNADVAKLVDLVAGLMEGGADTETKQSTAAAGPWEWAKLSTDDRVERWYELREWVAWYNDRYGSSDKTMYIPPCWPLHPVAVEELTGQMVAWQAAQAQTGPTDLIRLWHEHMYGAIERLTGSGGLNGRGGVLSRCSNGHHEGPKNHVDVRGVPDDEFAEMVREDVEAHIPAPDIEAA